MVSPIDDDSLLVEVVRIAADGNRPINLKVAELATLDEYAPVIKDAVVKVAAMMNEAAGDASKDQGAMRVDEIEASFSLTLGAEGKLVVAKASAQATLSVTLKIRRP